MEEVINANEQIERFTKFFEDNYINDIHENLRKEKKFVVVDFAELSKFDLDLGNELLENTEDTIKAAEIALQQFDMEGIQGTKVRITNLTESCKVQIRQIRSNHLEKFISVRCIVQTKTDIRPQIESSKFECPACGEIMNILQMDTNYREPAKCACGRKGKFTLLHETLIDHQMILVEELHSDLKGDQQPRHIRVHLYEDLTRPLSDDTTNPGAELTINGWLRKRYMIARSGGKTTRLELDLFANYIKSEDASMGITL